MFDKKEWDRIKFSIYQAIFFSAVVFFSCSALNVNSLKCVSINNQECKVRSEIININSNELLFYPYSILLNKCSGSCNNIDDTYAKLCVPDVVKNLNFKVFSLMSRTNKTRHIEWLGTFKCKCRIDVLVIKKQRWNNEKCRCECKELINKGVCDEGFI